MVIGLTICRVEALELSIGGMGGVPELQSSPVQHFQQ